jgi:hypothetical protein
LNHTAGLPVSCGLEVFQPVRQEAQLPGPDDWLPLLQLPFHPLRNVPRDVFADDAKVVVLLAGSPA